MRDACLPFLSPAAPVSAGGHLISKFEGRVDIVQRLDANAGPANGDVAKIEHPSQYRLIDIHAFNLVHVHLNRMPADEAPLVDDAAVSDINLGRPAPEPGPESQSKTGQRADERAQKRNQPRNAANGEHDEG